MEERIPTEAEARKEFDYQWKVKIPEALKRMMAMHMSYLRTFMNWPPEGTVETQGHVLLMIDALSNELEELRNCFPWRPWRLTEPADIREAKKEMIDILHFVLELFLLFKMSPEDIALAFQDKHEENVDRQLVKLSKEVQDEESDLPECGKCVEDQADRGNGQAKQPGIRCQGQ